MLFHNYKRFISLWNFSYISSWLIFKKNMNGCEFHQYFVLYFGDSHYRDYFCPYLLQSIDLVNDINVFALIERTWHSWNKLNLIIMISLIYCQTRFSNIFLRIFVSFLEKELATFQVGHLSFILVLDLSLFDIDHTVSFNIIKMSLEISYFLFLERFCVSLGLSLW